MQRLRRLMLTVLWAGMLCLLAGPAIAETQPGLVVKDGRFWKDGKPYRGVGANYFDLFIRTVHNSNDVSSCAGLKKLAEAGIPFVRFAGSPFSARDWRPYLENKEAYLQRMDLVVKTAEDSRIGLIPSLFWSLTLNEVVGETRDQWGNPDSRTSALMRQYVSDMVGRYKNSPAIWAWEFANEMNLSVDLPNAAQIRKKGRTERDDLKSEHLIIALTEFGKAVRKLDPHRALISGNSLPRPSAWHNTRERGWKADTREQTLEILLRDNPAPLDTISIHYYAANGVQKDAAAWAVDSADYFRTLKQAAAKIGRPLFVGEFGASGMADQAPVQAKFEEILAAMEKAQVDMAAFWVYDLNSQNKDWNVTSENQRAYMLKDVAGANRRWQQDPRALQVSDQLEH